MNSPVLPPKKLIVPREVCLLLGFKLFAVLWVHIFVVYSYTTKFVNIDFAAFLSVDKCHEFKVARAF